VAVAVAMLLFGTAVAAALVVVRPRDYNEVTDDGLEDIVSKERWEDDSRLAESLTASALVEIIRQHRGANRTKAAWLERSLWAQSFALLAVLVALALLLFRS
jgi:hypothetical protein